MSRLVIGIVVSSIVLFLWGFMYWGLSPVPYNYLKVSADDRAAGAALLEHFPEEGTYYLPNMAQDPKSRAALHEKGPIAFVHMTSRDGRPEMEGSVMVKGFLLNTFAVAAVALLLSWVVSALPSYGSRFAFVFVMGAVMTIFIEIGDVVWWYLPFGWEMVQLIYGLTAWAVVGLILPAFVRPD